MTCCCGFAKAKADCALISTLIRYPDLHCLPARLFMMQLLYRVSEFVQGLSSGISEAGVFASPLAAAYWAYHLTRTSFLTVQGLSGAHA